MRKKPISAQYAQIARLVSKPGHARIKPPHPSIAAKEPERVIFADQDDYLERLSAAIDALEDIVEDIEENGLTPEAGVRFFEQANNAAALLNILPAEMFMIYGFNYAEIYDIFMYEKGKFMEDDEICAILIDMAVELEQMHHEASGKPRLTKDTSLYQYITGNPYTPVSEP